MSNPYEPPKYVDPAPQGGSRERFFDAVLLVLTTIVLGLIVLAIAGGG